MSTRVPAIILCLFALSWSAVADGARVACRPHEHFGPPVWSAYRPMWADLRDGAASFERPEFVADMRRYQPQSIKVYPLLRLNGTAQQAREGLAAMRAITAEAASRGISVQTNTGMYEVPVTRDPQPPASKWDPTAWLVFEDILGPPPSTDPTTWLQVRADGSIAHLNPSPYGCPNNPDWRRYMLGFWLAQQHAGVRGGYVDNPLIVEDACYCKWCRAGFQEWLAARFRPRELRRYFSLASADAAEPPTDASAALWPQWLMFRRDSMAGFMRELREELHARDPDFMLSCNMGAIPNAVFIARGMDLPALAAACDYLYPEAFAAPRREGEVLHTTAPYYRYLFAAARGRPATPLGVKWLLRAGEYESELGQESLRGRTLLQLAEAAACGCAYEPHLSVARYAPPYAAAVHEWFAFIREHAAIFDGQSNLADVGVVCSLSAYYLGGKPAFLPTLGALDAHGIPAEALLPEDLTAKDLAARLRTIVLPPTPMLSNAQIHGLRRFVEEGGRVVMLGESGTHDERGVPRGAGSLMLPAGGGEGGDPSVGRVVVLPLEDGVDVAARWAGRLRSAPALLRVQGGRFVRGTLMHRLEPPALLVNLLNYDAPTTGPPRPAAGVEVTVALPEDREVAQVTAFAPGWEPMAWPFEVIERDGERFVTCTAPEFEVYCALLVSLA